MIGVPQQKLVNFSCIKGRANANSMGMEDGKKKNMVMIREDDMGSSQKPAEVVADSGEKSGKRGTIAGAMSLIVGTSIGTGILALPQKTSPAGIVPSAVSIIFCWVFLMVEALLLAEINVLLWKRRRRNELKGSGLEVTSLRTMAQETLGGWGGNLATAMYMFLTYTSVVAYTSKSGDILSHLTGLPPFISGDLFTVSLALIIAFGGTCFTDHVNQLLTILMIGLLVVIEVTGIITPGDFGSIPMMSNWEKVPATIPVIVFSLVYHDIAPVICAYLGGDLSRIRISIVLGSSVPMLFLLVWDDIALCQFPNLEGLDPLDLLKVSWSGGAQIIEAFSLLAVGTSLIGTLLGASQFLAEQLIKMLSTIDKENEEKDKTKDDSPKNMIGRRTTSFCSELLSNGNLAVTSLVVLPAMVISTTNPISFSVATDIAGGYCMMVLYGALPPMMAWAMHFRNLENDEKKPQSKASEDGCTPVVLSEARPILLGMGLLSLAAVMEQISMDLLNLNSVVAN